MCPNGPLEIFGYTLENTSPNAAQARQTYTCPFIHQTCDKRSRLIEYPFGVCTVLVHEQPHIICPRRFEADGPTPTIPFVLEDIARHYFGNVDNTVILREVRLGNVGNIDFVIVKHRPMQAEIEDFVCVEIQADSTTGTGGLVRSIVDYYAGVAIEQISYMFGMNTYDSIKRAMTQILNKGVVYEKWGIKSYWVMQAYLYQNLMKRYGIQAQGVDPAHATILAVYDLVENSGQWLFHRQDLTSLSTEIVFSSMKNNPLLPNYTDFLTQLTTKLRTAFEL